MNTTLMNVKDSPGAAASDKIFALEKLTPVFDITTVFLKGLIAPVVAFLIFLVIWNAAASQIKTSLGQVPGPAQVWSQAMGLLDEHQAEREKEQAFFERQEKRNAAKLVKNPDAKVKIRPYTGKPTFIDQIFTSLYTVAAGFFLASLIAIPIGIFCGLNATLYRALNPLIQVFKPVSPSPMRL